MRGRFCHEDPRRRGPAGYRVQPGCDERDLSGALSCLRSSSSQEFDDQDILLTLQLFLQRKAGEQGVDVSIHQDWERFLGYKHVEACEDRYARYLPERDDGDSEKKG